MADITQEAKFLPGECSHLKLKLLVYGISLPEKSIPSLKIHKAFHWQILPESIPRVDLVIGENVWISTPVNPSSPIIINASENPPCLQSKEDTMIPEGHTAFFSPDLSSFYQQKTSSGIPFHSFLRIYGGYVSLQTSIPDPSGNPKFFHDPEELEKLDEVSILEGIEAAFRLNHVRFIHLNAGLWDTEDRGIKHFGPLIQTIKRHQDTLVYFQSLPPSDPKWAETAYGFGVDIISYDGFSLEKKEKIIELPLSLPLDYEHCIHTLHHAAKIFPIGGVMTKIKPEGKLNEDWRETVQNWVSSNIVPLVTIPFGGKDRKKCDEKLEELVEMSSFLYRTARVNKLMQAWVSLMNDCLTPCEHCALLDPKGANKKDLVASFFRSDFGKKLIVNYASLRRQLKVSHKIED